MPADAPSDGLTSSNRVSGAALSNLERTECRFWQRSEYSSNH